MSSTKREIRHFHVVVVPRRNEMCKKGDARAEFLFCQSKPVTFFRSRFSHRRRRRSLNSLLANSTAV